ncbi:MAG: cytochrome P450 [Myxococcota bacterium]|nr:cytochrome P450 [Myxococcota bacterium]
MKDARVPPPPAELLRNPHPYWKRGRAECPVEKRSAFGTDSFFVLRHDDVEAVLRDPDGFSSSINQKTMGPYMGTLMLAMDGHEHSQYRSLVSHAFRRAALERWERELVRPVIEELVDRFAPSGRADLVRDVTSQYPVKVIAGIVGVPVEDHATFHEWAESINTGPLDPERGLAASRAMRDYLTPLVEERKREPRDDLISDIVTAEIDGERLDDEHIYGFLRLLMPAGAETTFRAMGNLLVALLTRPDELARVRRDRSLVPRAVEETLRWETSVTMVNRVSTRDTEIAGCPVPEGSSLILLTSSANRDESSYEDPEAWRLDREPAPHLAFGWGRHLCLGMHLARLELGVGLETLLDRLPNLRLDPKAPPPEIVGYAFRGPESLPVVFDPCA